MTELASYNIVGHATPRAEGPDKVTGLGKYGMDRAMEGMLWCKILRSPFAHARIVSIDTTEAANMPGVHMVLTGKDMEGVRTNRSTYKDEPALCWDTVLYVGDKVAAVVADDEDIAERALGLIQVEYEELTPVLSAREAAQPDATILHPDFANYVGVGDAPETPTNILVTLNRGRGDVEAGFADADLIVEESYTTPHQHQAYLEPHSVLVDVEDDGTLQIWMSCQLPAANVGELLRVLDLPPEKVVINTSYVGGSFGGKTDATGVYIMQEFSKRTGRPIKLVFDYSEELMASNPRHPSEIHVRAGVKRDGTITAWQAEAYMAVGAYASYAPIPNGLRGVFEMGGAYRCDNVAMTITHTYANLVPCGFARAPGMPQGLWAGESHIDLCARAIGMEPSEFRTRNIVHEGEALMTGDEFQAMRADTTLEEALRAADYSSAKSTNIGRGIGTGHHSQGGGAAVCQVTIAADDSITAHFSTFDTGGGTFTIIAQVVAEQLGVSPQDVAALSFQTNQLGPLQGIGGSRGARVTSTVGHQAATETADKLRRLAAEFQGWDEERLTLANGNVANDSGETISFGQIAARTGEPIVTRVDIQEGSSPYTAFGTQIAEVEVDPETGEVRVLKITAVHETGRVLNPVAFYGQLEGGVVYGFGETVMTETVYDESGRVTNPSFADMKLPTVRDLPELNEIVLESDVGDGPYAVRGIGEHTNIMTAPAIANAIEDAVGVRITSLPITAEKVYAALQAERNGGG